MRLRTLLHSLIFTLSVPLVAQAQAQSQGVELYRYEDKNGITVISRQGVPSDVIGKGYEVLNEYGRVVRVVPRAPTAEEIQQMQADKKQAEQDRHLLRLYSSQTDVERAEQRKLAEIDAYMNLVRRNLLDTQEDKADLFNQAANHERAGRKVPKDVLRDIDALERQEQNYQQEIERYQQLKGETEAAFALDKQRVFEILGK